MTRTTKFASLLVPSLGLSALASTPASALVDTEVSYIFNTFLFLFAGVLVMFMAAGFAMLEAGLVRSKNTATICLKNIALYSIACLMFYIFGYSLMYTDVSGWIGSLSFFYDPSADEMALIGGNADKLAAVAAEAGSYSIASDFFFQMVFVAAAASIVSGTLAERIKMWPFLIFVVVLTGVIYPIQGSWTWGGGWLSKMGFSDFAGSTIVHSVGGWAALVGAIILGPRLGKFSKDGRVNPIPGSNIPLATLGTFILWFGWFGFNGGSQLALGSAADATAISILFANTNMAAAAGVVAAMLASQIMFKKVDVTMALNGALAGLVSITAGPDVSSHLVAILIGGVGGALVVVSVVVIDKLKIDDVVGAISVHLVAGIWGTLAVSFNGTGNATFLTQLTGVVAIGAFVSIFSAIVFLIIKYTIGLRVSQEEELTGLDRSELGVEAYPDFSAASRSI